jgi:arginyl-tRNA synthetase
MTRGQISFEFIMMLGMGMILMIVFISAIAYILDQKNAEAKEELFLDLGESIQQEFLLANVVQDGYTRNFTIPPAELNYSFERFDYTINKTNDTLTIREQDHVYEFTTPFIEGTLHIGENTLQKINGKLYLNS